MQQVHEHAKLVHLDQHAALFRTQRHVLLSASHTCRQASLVQAAHRTRLVSGFPTRLTAPISRQSTLSGTTYLKFANGLAKLLSFPAFSNVNQWTLLEQVRHPDVLRKQKTHLTYGNATSMHDCMIPTGPTRGPCFAVVSNMHNSGKARPSQAAASSLPTHRQRAPVVPSPGRSSRRKHRGSLHPIRSRPAPCNFRILAHMCRSPSFPIC